MQLYEALSMHVAAWRADGYQNADSPAIGEIFEWGRQADAPTFRVYAPQLRVLETYWYLRLVEQKPHIFDLYQKLFPKKKELLEACASRTGTIRSSSPTSKIGALWSLAS